MIVLIDVDKCVYLFPDIEKLESYFEPNDLFDGEAGLIFDESGQLYKLELFENPSFLKFGKFKVRPTGKYDKQKIQSLLESGDYFLVTLCDNIKDMDELKRYIK